MKNRKIVVDGQEFTSIGSERRDGLVMKEMFFASDKSNVLITIDYTYTQKGGK